MANEIICVGDSITGWNRFQGEERERLNSQAYPRFLQELLDKRKNPERLEVINEGYDGARSSEAREIIGKYLFAPTSKYFIVNFGTNDVADELSMPFHESGLIDNLKQAVALVKSNNKTPLQMNLYYLSYTTGERRTIDRQLKDRYNYEIREYCLSSKIPLVDICSVIKPEHLLDDDGVHPNEAGAKLIAQEVYKVLEKIF